MKQQATLGASVIAGQTYDDFHDLPAGATATVTYRLDVPLREDAQLARPVLLRDHRRRVFSQENLVEDLALRLR